MWVQEIARRTASTDKCLEVAGHTSATGTVELNERLSLQRAQYVRDRFGDTIGKSPPRFVATGVGSRQLIVGTGRDDASDALDRRVEFKTIPCAGLTADSSKASSDKPVKKASTKPARRAASPKRYIDEDGNVRTPAVPGEVKKQLKSYGIDVD
jgi:hypothetical protein